MEVSKYTWCLTSIETIRFIRDGRMEVSKYTWCLTSIETIRLIRDREKGVWRWREREIIYLSLHCHHQPTLMQESF